MTSAHLYLVQVRRTPTSCQHLQLGNEQIYFRLATYVKNGTKPTNIARMEVEQVVSRLQGSIPRSLCLNVEVSLSKTRNPRCSSSD